MDLNPFLAHAHTPGWTGAAVSNPCWIPITNQLARNIQHLTGAASHDLSWPQLHSFSEVTVTCVDSSRRRPYWPNIPNITGICSSYYKVTFRKTNVNRRRKYVRESIWRSLLCHHSMLLLPGSYEYKDQLELSPVTRRAERLLNHDSFPLPSISTVQMTIRLFFEAWVRSFELLF